MVRIARALSTLVSGVALVALAACTETGTALDAIEDAAALAHAIEEFPIDQLADELQLTEAQRHQVHVQIQELHDALGRVSEIDPDSLMELPEEERHEIHHAIIADLAEVHEGHLEFVNSLSEEQRATFHRVLIEHHLAADPGGELFNLPGLHMHLDGGDELDGEGHGGGDPGDPAGGTEGGDGDG